MTVPLVSGPEGLLKPTCFSTRDWYVSRGGLAALTFVTVALVLTSVEPPFVLARPDDFLLEDRVCFPKIGVVAAAATLFFLGFPVAT